MQAIAAIMNESTSPGPDLADATPVIMKIPAPIIAPTPITVRPMGPMDRFSS